MAPDGAVIALAALLGAMLGSFLNVCVHRLPLDQSIVRPPSHCPRCGAGIAWFDNIPIVSWLLLRGRCRRCRNRISVRYPLVEAGTALIWALSCWHYGLNLDALAAAVFGTLLLGIVLTDAAYYIIPDEFTLGGLVLGLVLAARDGVAGVLGALLGAAVGFGALYAVAWAGEKLFRKEAMGGGDIKMMAMVGAFTGWQGTLLTVFLGALLGTLIFVPISLKTKKLVPFGIFLAAGAAVTFVAGEQLIAWYLDLVLGA